MHCKFWMHGRELLKSCGIDSICGRVDALDGHINVFVESNSLVNVCIVSVTLLVSV